MRITCLLALLVAVACDRTHASATAAPDAAPAAKLAAPPAPPPAPKTPAEACDAGDAAACLALARAAEPHGAFRAKLPPAEADARVAETLRRANRACDLGNGEGCFLAGRFDQSNRQAALLERGCELGQPAACGLLGSTRGGRRGAALLEKACVADATVEGHGRFGDRGGFCAELVELYGDGAHGEVRRDRAKVARFQALACAQGYKLGCPCKVDADCVHGDDDYFCNDYEGSCQQMSTD